MPLSRSLNRPAPLVNIAAISVILASLAAIGAVTGLIPSAFSGKSDAPVAEPSPSAAATAERPLQPRNDGRLAATAASPQCRQCGVIETVRQVQIKTHGGGLGAVAGGRSIVSSQFGRGSGRSALNPVDAPWGGYASPEADKRVTVTTGYRVVVRMEDGSTRAVFQSAAPAFGVGDKVRVVNGALLARG